MNQKREQLKQLAGNITKSPWSSALGGLIILSEFLGDDVDPVLRANIAAFLADNSDPVATLLAWIIGRWEIVGGIGLLFANFRKSVGFDEAVQAEVTRLMDVGATPDPAIVREIKGGNSFPSIIEELSGKPANPTQGS